MISSWSGGNTLKKILYILFILLSCYFLKAQSNVDRYYDSLALVQLYNQCNGISWTNNSGWLVDSLQRWEGVTVNGNRIDSLVLSQQNLGGSLPASLCNLTRLKFLDLKRNNLIGSLPSNIGNLTQLDVLDLTNNSMSGSLPTSICNLLELRYLYLDTNDFSGTLPSCFGNLTNLNSIWLTDNAFTGAIPLEVLNFPNLADIWISGNDFDALPDLTSLDEFSTLRCRYNRLTFEDIIPNKNFAPFEYVPQDSVEAPLDTLVQLRDTVTFTVNVFGTSYQWFKNGTSLSDDTHYNGTTTATLKINYCTFNDYGDYVCHIRHTVVPSLTLHRSRIRLSISDNRLPQRIFSVPGIPNMCGNVPAKLTFFNETQLPYAMELESGPGILKSDTLIPYREGSFVINLSNDGNDEFLPLDFDSTITVSLATIPEVEVEKTIPTDFGNEFKVNAVADPAVLCTWILPSQDSVSGNEYRIGRAFQEHEGVYTLITEKNQCRNYTESVELKFPRIVKTFGLITPNGDHKNDVLIIEGINKFPENNIRVFNVWQQQVYSEENYNNTWDGGNLPEGTYYLYLELKETQEIIQSSFVLRR